LGIHTYAYDGHMMYLRFMNPSLALINKNGVKTQNISLYSYSGVDLYILYSFVW